MDLFYKIGWFTKAISIVVAVSFLCQNVVWAQGAVDNFSGKVPGWRMVKINGRYYGDVQCE